MIGAGLDRIDGPDKVTGRARYSYERRAPEPAAYGVIVTAGIGKGRIDRIDTAQALAAPGVLAVYTHLNVPAQGKAVYKPTMFDSTHPQLCGPEIAYYGQPVALAVAETFEQAREAAALVEVAYVHDAGRFDMTGAAEAPELLSIGEPAESRVGDLDQALAEAAVVVDSHYRTPHHVANPLEAHGTLADWRDGRLTVYGGAQSVAAYHTALAETLALDPDALTVDSDFVGGGFGSKLHIRPDAVFAGLAARDLERPVKVALTRRQVFPLTGHRSEMDQHVRLAATADGHLLGVGHDVAMQILKEEPWIEQTATVLRPLYAAPHRLTRTFVHPVDIGATDSVRGPGEVPGMLAVECAMDELAEALGMDPVALRILNEPERHPERDVPFNGRRLVECLREGAERFGWDARAPRARPRREGRWRIGQGMAALIRPCFQGPCEVTVRLDPEGYAEVRADMSDIGTGARTIAAQLAAETLGLPMDRVRVRFARSDYPATSGAGGSWGAAGVSVALDGACRALLDALAEAEGGDRAGDPFATIQRHFPDGLERSGHTPAQADDPNFEHYAQLSYGAAFVEVGVDVHTGEVQLRRMTGVFVAGRILNAKTARSQLLGGMIWGVGSALHEGAFVDARTGSWVNGDFAEYLVPVHADIPDIDIVMLDDEGEHANALGIKGIGELGVCGSGAAVANAVYDATGVRVRDFPISLDKLVPGLPDADVD